MKKTFVTLACSALLLSVLNATTAFADDVNTPDAVATTTNNSTETSIPSADSVDTGNAGTETPSTPEVPTVPSTPETPSTPEVPTVPSTPETPSTPEVPTVPSTPETPSTPEVPTVPSTPETPSTPEVPTVPSTPETPSTPEVPTVPSATEDKKDDDKKLADDKKDNTHLPIVDPTAEDTKPIETDKGTVLSTDNGKVIIKNTETGEEQTFTPEELGGKVEKDGTVTIKEKDGKLTRLPNTGLEESASMLVAGLTTLFSGVGLLKRKKD
jgi:LPXTG-motif cell wall-anchored protein